VNLFAGWNETDPAARRALIDEVWSADARYIDPLADVAGRDQIDGLIGQLALVLGFLDKVPTA
jgi:hypothetical protein